MAANDENSGDEIVKELEVSINESVLLDALKDLNQLNSILNELSMATDALNEAVSILGEISDKLDDII